MNIAPSDTVIAGLDPAIHSVTVGPEIAAEMMPGSSLGITTIVE